MAEKKASTVLRVLGWRVPGDGMWMRVIVEAISEDGELLVVVIRTEQFGNQVKDWLNCGAASVKQHGIDRQLDKSVIRLSVATVDPFAGGCQQRDPLSLWGPKSQSTLKSGRIPRNIKL